MANNYFQFKQFTVQQGNSAMKVTTDACLFGAWVAERMAGKLGSVDDWMLDTRMLDNRILDIGTGTGLLSLMLAQKSGASIDAIEIDAAAAREAKENVLGTTWKDRINIIEGDIKNKTHFTARAYDMIISNPPFYENDLVSPDQLKNNARHDESLRLNELLELIGYYLKEDGEFYVLLPYKRLKDVVDGCLKNGLCVKHVALVKQKTGVVPFRIMISGRRGNETDYAEEEIVIRDMEYSERFVDLLKDYYLYL